jgi:hypothetical protein
MIKQHKGIFKLLIVAGIILTMLLLGIQTNNSAHAAEGQWSDHKAAALTLQDPLEPNSPTNAYIISTAEELALLSHNVNNGQQYINTYFLQTADIDLSEHYFMPIGFGAGKFFAGIYDGGGFEISGVSIVLSGEDTVGLFGNVNTTTSPDDEAGTLRNINITSGSIVARSSAGGIAGSFVGKKIQNCSSAVSIQSGTGSIQNFGGIAGINYGTIEDCYFYGSIYAAPSGQNIGGITGTNGDVLSGRSAKIKNCFNAGEVIGHYNVGGISGINHGDISAVYNSGTLTASGSAGGLVGYHEGGLSDGYSIGQLSFGSGYVGAIIGNRAENADANELYYNKSHSNGIYTMKAIGAESLNLSGASDSLTENVVGVNYYDMINNAQGMQLGDGWIFPQSSESFGYTPCFDSAQKEYAQFALFGGDAHLPLWGEQSNPYILNDPNQFLLLANSTNNNGFSYSDKYFELVSDINFASTVDYTPIGTAAFPFMGNFDGAGFTLKNLTVQSETALSALFGEIQYSSISNLQISNFYMSGTDAAALVGSALYCEINNVVVSGSNISAENFAGGIAATSNAMTIFESSVTDTYVVSANTAGGIVGIDIDGDISLCYSDAQVQSDTYAGGICGDGQGTEFLQTYFIGGVSGNAVGGLVGKIVSGSATQCFVFTDEISGTGAVGGIAGEGGLYTISNSYVISNINSQTYAAGFVGDSFDDGTISRGYLVGSVSSDGAAAVVTNGDADITDVYFNSDMIKNGVVVDGIPKNTIELTALDLGIIGFYMVARNNRTGHYPQLLVFSENQTAEDCTKVDYFENGDGSEAAPYALTNAFQLINMQRLIETDYSQYGSAHYKMLNDIILESEFRPIATVAQPFLGRLEGNYYSIYNLTINQPESDYVGLFRKIGEGARVTELNIRPYVVSPTEILGGIVGKNYVGAIAGFSEGFIWDCMNNTDVTGVDNVGGIAGHAKNISRSCNTGAVSGINHIGGIAGMSEGSIQSSFNSGYIKGNGNYIGGIAGRTGANNIIEVCYNSGDIESDMSGGVYQGDFKGGIAGYNYTGATIRNTYNIGSIKGASGMLAGGIIGENHSVEISLSYFNNEIMSGYSAVGTGITAGATVMGLTTVQMVGASALEYMVFSAGNYISAEEKGMDADFAPQLIIFYTISAEAGENADIIPIIKDYSKQSVMLRIFGRDVYNIMEWGGEYNPYRIETFDHLDTLSKQVLNGYTFSGCYFEVTADIVMQAGFLPIGRYNLENAVESFVFRGHFDGKGFTISNLVVGSEDTIYSQGLFGYIGENAVIKNVTISSGVILGSQRVGAVVGYSRGQVDRCFASATVEGINNVGGIVGMLWANSVSNSIFDGNVLGNSNWGGIVGFFEDQYASVSNCWYIKDINAADSHNRYGSILYVDKNGEIAAGVDNAAANKDFIYFEFLPESGFGFEMRNVGEDVIAFTSGGIQGNKYFPMYNQQAAAGATLNWYARFTKSVTISALSNATATGAGNYYEGQSVVITVYPEKGYRLVLDYGTYVSYIGDGDYVDCVRIMGDYAWEFSADIVPFGDGATEIINPDGIKASIEGDSFAYDGQPKLYYINIPGFVAYTEYYRVSPRIRVDEPINATQYQLIIKLQEGGVIVGSKIITYDITPLKLTLDLEELQKPSYSTKQYDKYSYNEISIGAAAIIGVVGGDEVILTAVRKYFEDGALNPNIGDNKLITFETFNLSGAGASNYSVPDIITDIPGSIIKRTAWINILSTNLSKQYDGERPIIVAHSFEGDLGDGLFVNEFSFTRIGEPSGGEWDAGLYTIGLTENIAGNKENYNIMLKESYTFEIKKKVISNVTFLNYQNLSYNGASQADTILARYPLTANTFGYADLVFYHNNQQIDASEVKNAGTYIAQAVISAEDNHNFELDGEKSVSFSISRINQTPLTLVVDIDDYIFAQQKSAALSVSGGSGEGALTYEVVQGKANITGSTLYINGAGTIAVRATKAASTNYFSQSSNTVTFSISKAVLRATLDDIYVSYGDIPEISIVYKDQNDDAISKAEIDGLIEPEAYVVGENLEVKYNEYGELEGYDILLRDNGSADGYLIDVSEISAKLIVVPKQVHVIANPATKIYGAKDPSLTFRVLEGDITLEGEIKRAAGENRGKYLIEQHTLTNENNPNYDIVYVPDYFTISPKELRVSIPIFTKIYGQLEPAYQRGARVPEGVNFVINDEQDLQFGDNLSLLTGEITRAAGETAGQYAFTYRNVSAGDNYAVIVTEVKYFVIQKATPVLSVPPTASAITYGEALADSGIAGVAKAVINGVEQNVPGQFIWKNSGIRPSVLNSNLTEYAVSFIPNDEVNYNKVDAALKLTVRPRRISIAFIGTTHHVYDGSDKAFLQATAYNVLPNDEVAVSVTYSSPYLVNAGEYTAFAHINDPNYEPLGEATTTIIIARSQLDVTVADAVIFEDDDYTPQILYSGFKGGDDVSVLSSLPSVRNIPKTPGQHALTPQGGAADNYLMRYIPGKLIINRRELENGDIKLKGELPHAASIEIRPLNTDSGTFTMINGFVKKALAVTPHKNSVLDSFNSIALSSDLKGKYTFMLKLAPEGQPIVVQHTDGSIELLTTEDYNYEDGYVSFVSSNVSGVGLLREATFIEKYGAYMLYAGIGAVVVLIGVLIGFIAKKIKKRRARLIPKFRD